MGYKINSIWKERRKNDIEKLNAIIDDEYCNELEIGRKLNLMEKFNNALEEALDEFDFNAVIQFMKDNDWEWAHYENGKSFYAVPTKKHIIETIKNDFFKHGLYEIIVLNKTSFRALSGGIVFDMNLIDGKAFIDIYFDIAHFRDGDVY